MTPGGGALVSEALRKPAERISARAPKGPPRTRAGAPPRRPAPDAADTRPPESVGARGRGPERLDPDVPEGGLSADDPFGLRAAAGPRRSWWKLGLATG